MCSILQQRKFIIPFENKGNKKWKEHLMVPDLEIEEGLDKVCELSIGIWVGVLIFLISYSICTKIITSNFFPDFSAIASFLRRKRKVWTETVIKTFH